MAPKNFCYEYPRPAVTTDCVLFSFEEGELRVLLIRRRNEPFAGMWAFPGGFVEMRENCDECAVRELHEETGMKDIQVEQIHAFSDVDRDPRERVISVSYMGLISPEQKNTNAGDDASEAGWFPVNKVPRLAFDHGKILDKALGRLRDNLKHKPSAFELLPKNFTMPQLHILYEKILNTSFDRRNFSRRFISTGMLKDENEKDSNVAHRGARYFSFDKGKFKELLQKGYEFRI